MDVSDLRGLFLFDGLSDEKLAQLVAAGEEVRFEEGQELFREGDIADFWWVLIEGGVHLVRRAGREEAVVMMTMDRPGLWAGGFQAWDEASSYLATGRGASSGRMFRIASPALGELAHEWFPFGVHLIKGFFQTVRSMDALSRQREQLIGLGRIAASLAHELNNPASAAARAVDELNDECDTMLASMVRLAEQSMPGEDLVALDALRRELDASGARPDPLVTADREEELAGWLAERGVDDSWMLAPELASGGADVPWCERVAEVLDPRHLGPALEWVASILSTKDLLGSVKEASRRISGLVDATKAYSQVDRPALQLVDVTEGIESTLVMLGHKLSEGVEIARDYEANAPEIEAIPAELNQVWTNLIENALDAMDGSGTLRISTRAIPNFFQVEIGDTGPGMPPEVQARAFDPFFTTKELGKGTGLGLDISRRIVVERHHGQIAIDSRPGETVLCVRLPLHSQRPAS
jgi:signal transduction histidine kinase